MNDWIEIFDMDNCAHVFRKSKILGVIVGPSRYPVIILKDIDRGVQIRIKIDECKKAFGIEFTEIVDEDGDIFFIKVPETVLIMESADKKKLEIRTSNFGFVITMPIKEFKNKIGLSGLQ